MDSPQRIRLARRHAGLSQTRLAQQVGVQRSAVSHWESSDGKNPNVSHLRKVATVTGVNFEWLATGRGSMQIATDLHLDSISAVAGMLIEDDAELRLIRFYRDAAAQGRVLIVELAKFVALHRRESRKTPVR